MANKNSFVYVNNKGENAFYQAKNYVDFLCKKKNQPRRTTDQQSLPVHYEGNTPRNQWLR